MKAVVMFLSVAMLTGCASTVGPPDVRLVASRVVEQVPQGERTAEKVQEAFRGAGYVCSPVSTFRVMESEDALLVYDGAVFTTIPTKISMSDSQFANYRNTSKLVICTKFLTTKATSAKHQIDLLFDSAKMLIDASTRSRKD